MKLEKAYALGDWVSANRTWMEEKNPTLNEVIGVAQKVLGFSVSPGAMKTATASKGLKWDGRRTTLPIGRLGSKHARTNISRTLARAIVQICDALGMEVDPGVSNVARGRALNQGTHADGE